MPKAGPDADAKKTDGRVQLTEQLNLTVQLVHLCHWTHLLN